MARSPCQRCGNLELSCLYAPNCCSNSFKDSDEFKVMSVEMKQLQEQVAGLAQNMAVLRSETLRLAPIQDRLPPVPPSSISPSPSTSLSSAAPARVRRLAAATAAAREVGPGRRLLSRPHEHGLQPRCRQTTPSTRWATSASSRTAPPPMPPTRCRARRPSLADSHLRSSSFGGGGPGTLPEAACIDFDRDEIVRLCRAHDEEVGIMYPVVSIQTVITHARLLSAQMEAARRGGPAPPINDDKTLILKMVMCCALAVREARPQREGHTRLRQLRGRRQP